MNGAIAPHRSTCIRESAPRRAFSLVELLIAVAVVSVLAALILPSAGVSNSASLQAAARILVADLDYARSLAVQNQSAYRVTFRPPQREYFLEHAGADTALDTLPRSPFRHASDPPTRQTTRLDEMPGVMGRVDLARLERSGAVVTSDLQLVFEPLGQTTGVETTVIWLAAGRGAERCFIPVVVQPVTGLASVGPMASSLP